MKVTKRMSDFFGIGFCILIAVFVILFFLISCSPKLAWQYEGKSYKTSGEVLEAQKRDNEAILSNVLPTKNPLSGSAIIILPTSNYMRKIIDKAIRKLRGKLKEEIMDHTTQWAMNKCYMHAEAVRRSNMFDKVITAESDTPENTFFNEDFAIVFINFKEGANEWVLRKKQSQPTDVATIKELSINMPPLLRINKWLNDIEIAAKN